MDSVLGGSNRSLFSPKPQLLTDPLVLVCVPWVSHISVYAETKAKAAEALQAEVGTCGCTRGSFKNPGRVSVCNSINPGDG